MGPTGSRPSLGRKSGVSRRSTMGRGRNQKEDPRPIMEKAYKNTMIRTLITFLGERGYDHQISPKILTNPTGKDFYNIVTFLWRGIDPNLKFTTTDTRQQSKEFQKKIPFLFKQFGYPFNISKTALSAVGSPHTWPALLASLTWLIELLNYDFDCKDDEQAQPV